MKYEVIDANEVCARISYLFSEVVGVYPITPATKMSELIKEYSINNKKNLLNNKVDVTEMQSEKGAIALVHGALQTGSLSSTYTSSQGLLLMLPSMYKIAGEMLPCVINVASRTVSTHALSILSDHSDIYAVRSSGFSILSSSNVQDVAYMTLLSYLSSISSSMPFINFFEGFRTSHELNKIKMIDIENVRSLVDFNAIKEFKKRSLITKKRIVGTNQSDDIYFQSLESKNKVYESIPDTVNKYMKLINKKFDVDYKPFNYYGYENAEKIIVAMGTVCDTVKEYIKLSKEKVGLIEVHLFRPFSSKYFFDVLPKSVKKIAVLDKAKEMGSSDVLYLDVLSLIKEKNLDIKVIGGRYGISSKNTSLKDINAVYRNLGKKNSINSFTIGIIDDVTNKSLKTSDLKIDENKNNIEMIIYGYGSDGMVSASKDIVKLIGDNTNGFTQGYFKYDSKKSRGLTISHIRIGKEEIRLPYEIENPHIIVCSNDYYLEKYDILKNARNNSIFILITDKEDVNDNIKYYINKKNIKFYKIDAYKIAKDNNIPDKISTIVEAAILYITKLLPHDLIEEKLSESIRKKYTKKGEDIVENNINSILKVNDSIIEVTDKKSYEVAKLTEKQYDNLVDKINHLEDIKVSDVIKHSDGSFSCFTSENEQFIKPKILPNWKSELCIQCNKCSIVCPHGVIEPKILTDEEIKTNNNIVYEELLTKEGYKFALEINYDKCTGCGICQSACMGKRGLKALEMVDSSTIDKVNEKINASHKNLFDENTIKGVGFNESLFRFPSACKGCGETPYLKLLTKIHKDGIIIANATGCSSIYGGNINNPYNVSWASSLFEDNAEYGLGMRMSINVMQNKIENIMKSNLDKVKSKNKKLFEMWLNNKNDYKITKEVMENIEYKEVPELTLIKDYIATKSVWIIGGDGWSYDIDFDGIDHIIATKQNVNILILDTEIYSNTGGQTSKSTPIASVSKYKDKGNDISKKDLAKMMMSYNDVYIAQISLGANINQSIKAIKEAEKFDGPSLIIAYSPCINHGIKNNSFEEEKLAVQSGYFPLFRYDGKLTLDYTSPDFNLYDEFLRGEKRYKMINAVNKEKALDLLKKNKEEAIKRFEYYKSISKQ